VYIRTTSEAVQVLMVHSDDPMEVYLTVAMTDGREKQTVFPRVRRIGKPSESKGKPSETI